MRRIIWAGSLSFMLGVMGTNAQGGDVTWRPASPPQADRPPAATLDRPVPRGSAATVRDPEVTPVSLQTNAPAPAPSVIRAQGYDSFASPPPPLAPPGAVPPPPGAVPLTPGAVPTPVVDPYGCGVVSDAPLCSPFGFGSCCLEREWFRSDHCFDQFISPITNPFLFEDPRSLTEIRPILIYQSAPSRNSTFGGGNLGFFGMQARLAITDRFSFVMNKLGFVWTDPNSDTGLSSETGFAEVWLGPKYTFLRSESTGTLGAIGLTFQIPAGSQRVFQNTGDLSLVPYLSMGQNFWRTSYGSVNALGTVGYSFATENHRSDYFFLSLHLDYDIANLHKIYPLIELNWTHYGSNGNVRNLNFEGRDLINFGSTNVTGNDNLTLATGLRYKFSETIQTGIAGEWSVSGRKDLLDFRLTADLIFRY